jgi:hypothetical protein
MLTPVVVVFAPIDDFLDQTESYIPNINAKLIFSSSDDSIGWLFILVDA